MIYMPVYNVNGKKYIGGQFVNMYVWDNFWVYNMLIYSWLIYMCAVC